MSLIEDEDSDNGNERLYRTNGFWYTNAYHTLNSFVSKLKLEIALKGMDLPFDVEQKLLTDFKDTEWKSMETKIKLLKEFDKFINLELISRLKRLHIPYNKKDNYVNVVNYAKANNIDLSNDTILLNDVCVWLGLTDWNSNSGGQSIQLERIKNTIKQMSQAGGKKYKKKSRRIAKIRKISKKVNDNY